MSPRNAGYVEMKPATDGYVEMHASLRAGSATLFPLELDPADGLGPLRELSEEARPPPEPHYVSLANRTHDDAARGQALFNLNLQSSCIYANRINIIPESIEIKLSVLI